jgi:diguanylate cyclase (GGDEF)-like protein/PAS domain S-box-containing protein
MLVLAGVAWPGWAVHLDGAQTEKPVARMQVARIDADLAMPPAHRARSEMTDALSVRHSDPVWLTGLGLFLLIGMAGLGAHFWRRTRVLQAEIAERRAAELGLRESERNYRDLVEAAPFPVVISSGRRGRIRFMNSRSEEYFGVGRAQILGRPIAEFCQDPGTRRRLVQHLGQAGKLNDIEVRLHDAHGQPFWGLVSAARVEFEGRDGVFIALNDITERKHLEARLEHQINTDDLTGLASRRRILDLLLQEFERARRYASPLAILAVDIDHFKQINDTCGHDGGDEALRVFAGVLRGGLRSPDMAGRMGGEEFMVVLPETGPEEARQAAERLRQMVEARGVSLDKKILRLTVSIGIASIETCDSVEELMKAADHALYAAKDAGRNRCVFQSCKLH